MGRIRAALAATIRPVPALLCDLAAISGVGLICWGAWRVYEPAGLIAAGGFLLASAWLGQRRLS